MTHPPPGHVPPVPGRGGFWLRNLTVSWSMPAAARALRAMIIVPGLFALCFYAIGSPQMTVYAVFGSFGALLFSSFGGSRRDKAVAHLGLAVAGTVTIVIGTLVSDSVWVAAVVTIPVAFALFFAAVAGPNPAGGVTATLLAYVLPVASAGSAGVIPDRLAGWWLAQVVTAASALLIAPRSAGDQLREAAANSATALGAHVRAILAGAATPAGLEWARAAKHELLDKFASTPYRPIGLAAIDQALVGAIHMLAWSTELTCDAMGGELDLSTACAHDRAVLAEAAGELTAIAALLQRQEADIDLRRMWHARTKSASRMLDLSGGQAGVRRGVGYAFHAQVIGLAVSSAAADAMIAARKFSPDEVARQRRHWVDGLSQLREDPLPLTRRILARIRGPVATDASRRSVWFRNSARGAIALAGAVAVAKLTNVQHGFWVVLGTLSVLRTSAWATGATVARALAGTLAGFAIGSLLVAGIGVGQAALWTAFPIAVLIAAYTPGTAPFAAGQAAFTVAVVVLFNLLDPAGWQVGLLRVEDVALGCAVSAAVGILFWPRGAASVVGDNLAVALRSGADYLTESARWALNLGKRHASHAITAVAAGTRLDDAMRGFLGEQGSKRIAKADLWTLVMAAQRIRLTAHSLSSLPVREHRSESDQAGRVLTPQYAALAVFYDRIAAQVGPPARRPAALDQVPLPASSLGLASADPEALWVGLHLEQLETHAAGLPGPARKLASLRRTPWWRSP
ncbi:MAG TPA: FUSC family protein [Streptosporangiaceae bacterium]|nr:FUSC family protein [Streptosporangiaceae bacterium]